jgi:hypothetical protein
MFRFSAAPLQEPQIMKTAMQQARSLLLSVNKDLILPLKEKTEEIIILTTLLTTFMCTEKTFWCLFTEQT